jgi:hypothetical protein
MAECYLSQESFFSSLTIKRDTPIGDREKTTGQTICSILQQHEPWIERQLFNPIGQAEPFAQYFFKNCLIVDSGITGHVANPMSLGWLVDGTCDGLADVIRFLAFAGYLQKV